MNKYKNNLSNKISSKEAVIAVIGLGYIGLPLVHRFSSEGFNVIGLDINQDKVDSLNKGENYIKHLPKNLVTESIENNFKASTDFSLIKKADALIICVPTPLSANKDPDLSYIINALDSMLPYLRKGQIVSLENSTYPFTTRDVVLPKLESNGLIVGQDIFLVYSPEREDPGNQNFSIRDIPKVVSGITEHCLDLGRAVFGSIVNEVIPVSKTQTAEMVKLLENIHRAVNIGLVNEMKIVSDKMGIDIHEVINAAATKPFGFTPFYPGPGLGGHCIPIDPFYLTWKAKEFGLTTKFIELAGEINANMPSWVVSKVADTLNNLGKSISKSKILVLGVAYKKNVGDLRESPAIEIIETLIKKGANIEYSDPFVTDLKAIKNSNFNTNSIDLTEQSIANKDVVIITTDHDQFDLEFVQQNALKIIDTRGAYKESFSNVIRA